MKMRFFLISTLILFLVNCASYFLKKDCESTNWYEYGQKLAESGHRLESDNFLSECRKAEAVIAESKLDLGFKSGRDKYCTMDEIYNVGKSGKIYNYELCDHLPRQKVKDHYLEGIKVFCKPENGFSVGAKGESYEKVCPENMEQAFLKEYNRGRKAFLETSIKNNEGELIDIDKDLTRVQSEKSYKANQLSRLPIVANTSTVQQTKQSSGINLQNSNPATSSANGIQDPFKQERDRLQTEVNSLNSQIRSLENKRDNLKEEIRKMRTEMVAL